MHQFEETKRLLDDSNIYYLIAVGVDSNYSYVNKRYQRIFEKVHGNLVGQHFSLTMHPDDVEVCRAVSKLAVNHPGKAFPAMIRKHDGKGGYVITQWEFKAIFDAANQPAGMFCIGHDITEFMLNSTELKDTKEILTKTKLTLDQINYIQSHVVRKPIANIMGLTLLLESMTMEPGVENMFKMINESAKELDQLIRNMANIPDHS
ncbi:PAS domain-containing protein [Pedobacter sp. L105]|uniref:PAS domain-containing protein n=1 Tax=Pedobacter sp. L105 TaxID=1641871 RepID=UPI00131C459C|nr:PAS domain-containing protein [Pedobacter sp. L105]